MTKKITTKPFDIVNYIHSEKDIEDYLNAVFEYGSDEEMVQALANVIRAKGILKTSKETGVSRSGLYKTFINNGGSPTLATLNKLVKSFGYNLSITPPREAKTV